MNISKSQIEAAARKRIVFAHQSVGRDILAGVRDLANEHGVQFPMEETRQLDPARPGFSHFRVGRNRLPEGKIADFLSIWEQPALSEIDVAMLKLCYVDFDAATDAQRIAESYISAMKTLKARLPRVRFVALTVPLTTIETGPKAWLKRATGKLPKGYEENGRRQQFNQALRKHFIPDEIFDVAAIEAGVREARQTFELRGEIVDSLPAHLTYDGGHLNELGRKAVAADLIRFLGGQGTAH